MKIINSQFNFVLQIFLTILTKKSIITRNSFPKIEPT